MKKLIPFVTPILMFCVLCATTEPVHGEPTVIKTTKVSIVYADNLVNFDQNAIRLPEIDLSKAIYNPTTGKSELVVEVVLPQSTTNTRFFGSIATETTQTIDNGTTNYSSLLLSPPVMSLDLTKNPAQPMMIESNIWFGILILVIGAIIIYVLIRLAKRLLPP